MTTNTQTPREIDTHLAEVYYETTRLRARRDSTYKHVAGEIGRYVFNRGWKGTATSDEVRDTLAEWDETPEKDLPFYARGILRDWNLIEDTQAKIDALILDATPYETQYRKHLWSRFFLAQATNGHIHSSMDCSTCNNGKEPTRFAWLPDLSGKTEADAVADQGALLCTTCFPSAPTEWTNHYEKEAEAKKAAQCPGSGTYDYPRETARMGYYSGNYGTCNHCGERVSLTKTNKMRSHKPA